MSTFVNGASLHANYLPYVIVCNYITESDLSIVQNMYAFEGIKRLRRISFVRQHVNNVIIYFFKLIYCFGL
jgi:hypothetical protein